MMVAIDNLKDFQKLEGYIGGLFSEKGTIFQQSFGSIKSEFIAHNESNFVVVVGKDLEIVGAFEKKNNSTWSSVILGHPLLGIGSSDFDKLNSSIESIAKSLGSGTIYFPLVYQNDPILSLDGYSKYQKWERHPSPIVDEDLDPNTIWERVVERYGSRAKRQKRKFEQNLKVRMVKKEDAAAIIEAVEKKSWKAKSRQDMFSRGNQFVYYSNLILNDCATITAAYKDEIPVAFRIDALAKNVLYVLKWSYNDDFKKFSPGFYLLTVDLWDQYKDVDLEYVDLYGSPDMLKDLMETKREPRWDLIYSDSQTVIDEIKQERLAFDEKTGTTHQQKQSIKNTFIISETK